MSRNRVYGLMVLASVFSSGAFVTGKLAVQEFPPCTLTFFRFLMALPFIFLIHWRARAEPRVPTARQWGPLIGMGILGPVFYHVLFFESLQHTSAINDSLIGSSLPLAALVLSSILLRDRVSALSATGIVVAFSGILLVVSNGSLGTIVRLQFNPGDGWMLLAVLCWALYMVLSRPLMRTAAISPVAWTAYTFLVCTIVTLPCALAEHPASFLGQVSVRGWLSVGYMALFSSVLAYWFQQIGVQEIGPTLTAAFTNLVPAFTMVLSVLVLHEPLTALKLTSAALIILGVYLGSRSPKTG